jgi:hypothetical protein
MCIREHSNTNLMQKLNKVYSLCEILLFGIQDLAMINQKAATKVRECLETTELNGFNEHLEKIQNMAIQIEGPDEGGQDGETADMIEARKLGTHRTKVFHLRCHFHLCHVLSFYFFVSSYVSSTKLIKQPPKAKQSL